MHRTINKHILQTCNYGKSNEQVYALQESQDVSEDHHLHLCEMERELMLPSEPMI